MSYHILNSVILKIFEAEDSIGDEYSLQIDRFGGRISIISKYLQGKIRNRLPSIGLPGNVEDVPRVLWKFDREEVFESIEVVLCRILIVVGIFVIVVDAVASTCRGIDEEKVGEVQPRVRVGGERFLVVVGLALPQDIGRYFLDESDHGGASRSSVQPKDNG
jgi:hypothetical protein